MNAEPSSEKSYEQPVAYDAQGNPLYAHPPKKDKTVHRIVQVEPIELSISPEARKLHERSKRVYPNLNLSESEYVISAVRRHPIGLVVPLIIGTLVIAFATSILANYESFADYFNITGVAADVGTVILPILLFDVLIALGMFIMYYVYINNKFFLTNESVIQEIQLSPFSKLEQTMSLSDIKDASYTQTGIIQTIFDYGSIRLNTEGDETTYKFTYVARPKKRIDMLNDAVEEFKNSRLIDTRYTN